MNADSLIEEIDSGTIAPRTWPVIRALHRHMSQISPLQRNILVAFDRGDSPDSMAPLRDMLWASIRSQSPDEQGCLRLSVGLTRDDEPIDAYLAEFLIQWAREQKLTEQQIIDAFHGK
ncbi:hypothetical protein GS397_20775 [Sphingobium yanoikuyae]|uniref:Uncharacterized protein n=1 Tax=Sphingobium yanoikuyae TaxID=13690 RepID=A0A6P1GLY3_SPHYA|nr:hypothetical protein [Sphingobium yanoikuyae]QHD69244.1 hypothetical protein GS397_20775 [Sphingobium yanoikuyae]